MKKIVAITGPDGSGKSTLIKKWIKEASAHSLRKVQEVSIWDALFQEPVKSSFPISPKNIDSYLAVLDTRARALFLAHAIQQALAMATQNPDVDVLLINGYWMKYFACEMVHGGDEEWLLNLAALFPKPDQVIYLDLPVSEALKRKDRITGYESGFAEPDQKPVKFELFQNKVHPILHRWKKQFHWNSIDTTGTAEETFQQSKAILHGLLS